MNKDRGFYFTTNQGNCYFYNDITGRVELQNQDYDSVFVYGENNNGEAEKISKYEISEYFRQNGHNQMILVVTEKCNIRCKYCVYSGNYDNQREHGHKEMSFEIAKKAIDIFYKNQVRAIQNNSLHLPLLGFYGGEPLLNFQLIKDSVAYAKEVFNGNIKFLMTTNGTILTDEIADFLIQNNFALSISLNGSETENDRLRVFENGLGTFQIIKKSINLLQSKDMEYFKKNVSFIGCYDWKSDLDGINEFCKHNQENIPELSRLSLVNDYFSEWYSQFSIEEKDRFITNKTKIGNDVLYKLSNGEKLEPIERLLYSGVFMEVLNRSINTSLSSFRPPFMRFTGSCIPGTKLCVHPNGEFHCCEKINATRKIGDVYNGIDIDLIAEMLKDYMDVMAPTCSRCPVQRLCPICFTACLDGNGNFTRSQIGDCKNVLKSMQDKFTYVYNALESGVSKDELLNLNHIR